MKYHIISMNDARLFTKGMIRREMQGASLANVETFNAYENDSVRFLEQHGIKLDWDVWKPKVGELGIWASVVNCWNWCVENNEDLLVFEDDAIPVQGFIQKFNQFYNNLPKDYDFAAIWVPENQRGDYYYSVIYDDDGCPRQVPRELAVPFGSESMYEIPGRYPVSKVYQGYGGVSMLFSPGGSRKLFELSRKFGLYTPVDCHFYLSAHRPNNNVSGYAPHPDYVMVDYDWSTPTTIQTSERVQ